MTVLFAVFTSLVVSYFICLWAWKNIVVHNLMKIWVAAKRDKDAARRLCKAALSGRKFKRCFAIYLIGNLGDKGLPFAPIVCMALDSDDIDIRSTAVQALISLGKDGIMVGKDKLIEMNKSVKDDNTKFFIDMALKRIAAI